MAHDSFTELAHGGQQTGHRSAFADFRILSDELAIRDQVSQLTGGHRLHVEFLLQRIDEFRSRIAKIEEDCLFGLPDSPYAKLAEILQLAYRQASAGKGAERHGIGLKFEDQRMQTISELLRSPYGMAFQAIKKLTEALDMPSHERREHEMLGVIVYVAGLILYLRNQEAKSHFVEPD